jgi:hypothetical protein
MKAKSESVDKGLAAVKTVFDALEPLDDALRNFVLTSVGTLLGKPISESARINNIPPAPQQIQQPAVNPAILTPAAHVGHSAHQNNGQAAKLFMKSKQPASDVQRVTCLAYYLTHSMSQPQFKTKDITKLNSDAGQIRLSNPTHAITNAERQNGFIVPAGRGLKQITSLGEDVVAALPDQEQVKIVLSNHHRPRRNKSKAKKVAAK